MAGEQSHYSSHEEKAMQPNWNILAQLGATLWLALMSVPLVLLPAIGVRLFDSLPGAVGAAAVLALLLATIVAIIGGLVAVDEPEEERRSARHPGARRD